MGETDRQTDKLVKSTRWSFTAYEQQWDLFKEVPAGVAEWGFQTEVCPKTDRKHYQGYIRLSQQQRFGWLAKLLPGVHLEVAKNWDALIEYCKKTDTAVPGTQVHVKTKRYDLYTYAEYVGKVLATTSADYEEWSDDAAMEQIRLQARLDIRKGHREVAFIVGNPMWVLYWKYWKDILISYKV